MAATQKIIEGVFAINKPAGISSAQVLRDLQTHFDKSKLFQPWLESERHRRAREPHFERNKRRRTKRGPVSVKIGHGGTLDPIATGVLIAGIGKGTKDLPDFIGCIKTYETVVLFGAASDTYDRVGKIIARKPYDHVTRELVTSALSQFRGKIMQRPPIYSALRIDGKRLYEYAREGKALPKEIEERPVEVLELDLVEWLAPGSHTYAWPAEEAGSPAREAAEAILESSMSNASKVEISSEPGSAKRKRTPGPDTPVKKVSTEDDNTSKDISAGSEREAEYRVETSKQPEIAPPAAKIRMKVSSGFYVRSLCHDLGIAVKSCALMSELVRTQQQDFELGKNVFEYDRLKDGEDAWGPELETMLEKWNTKKS